MLFDPYKVKCGDRIYTFVQSSINPQIYTPIKGRVESIIPRNNHLLFLIKPQIFYTTSEYLKTFFFGSMIKHGSNEEYNRIGYPDWVKDKDTLEEFYKTSATHDHYIIIQGHHCIKNFTEFCEIFDALNFYQISRTLMDLKFLTNQTFYKGNFKFISKVEFTIRLKDMLKDKVKDIDIDEYLNSLGYNWINE